MKSTSTRAGDDNQRVQVGGGNHAPVTVAGGIAVGGDVSGGITIQSAPDREGEVHTFDIAKKVRIPVSARTIGVVSGVISIVGFVTGLGSIYEYIQVVTSMTGPVDPLYFVRGIAGLLLVLLSVRVLVLGAKCCSFLQKNILHLPKRWFLPAFAGIRNERGRTFPYLLRLSLKCPKCADRNLRFKRVQNGREWMAMAVCSRYGGHSLPVDISGNDFDRPLPR